MAKDNTRVIEDKYASQKDIIIKEIENGLWFQDAIISSGISRATGYRLVSLEKEDRERLQALQGKDVLEKQEQDELNLLLAEKELCEIFETRIEAAKIVYKKRLISLVNLAAIKNGSHALEMLRIRFPEEFNLAKKLEHTGGVSIEIKTIAEEIQKMIATGSDEDDKPETPDSGN